MTTTLAPTALSVRQRAAVAADRSWGAGNMLQAAIASSPRPELALIHLARPLVGTDGQPLRDLSLLDLDALADGWAAWYCEQGVQPRDRVAVWIEDSFAYSVHYYALSRIGAIGVMINSWAPTVTANALCGQTAPVGIYSDDARLERLWAEDACALRGMRWTQSADDLPAPPAAVPPDDRRFRHADEDPVSILHSSGTTGRPKPVIQTHQSSIAGPRFRMANDVVAPGERVLTALPQSHIGAISFSSYALLCGTPLVALYDPASAQLLDAIREHRPTAVMGFSHIFTELAAYDVPAGELDCVERWISVGDAIHEPHIRTLLQHRSSELGPSAFLDRLGSTELGWALLLHTTTVHSGPKGRCIGRPTGAGEVVVLRKDGTKAAAGELGLLAAKGPTITIGYWNDSETNYRSRLAGYWLSGDVASYDEDGLYYQVDRAVDAIETGSHTGYSVLMEEVLLAGVADICDCGVVAGRWGDETVAVALVRTTGAGADADRVLRAANDALRAAGHPEVALLEVARTDADYPVGVTGKVLKRVLRDRYDDLERYVAHGADKLLAARPPGDGAPAAAG
jgi:acyl-coenzyme A synthetase/AMP-(fatty) acid ligase